MDTDDRFNPKMDNDIDKDVADLMSFDRGYSVIYRLAAAFPGGRIKRRPIKVFSSAGVRTQIRNAETGIFYTDLVGSKNEDKYFKVAFAKGVLTSKNNSSTLFYNSPDEYMRHMNTELDECIIDKWQQKQHGLAYTD
jgi:hypothetical protein